MGARIVILSLVLGTVLSASGEDTEAKTGDLAKLQGTWEAMAGPMKNQPLRMTIKGTELTLRYTVPDRKKPIVLQGRIKLDESSRPKAMDWIEMHVELQKLPPIFSIYELKNDTLRVRGSGAKERPTEFQDDDNVPRHRSLSFKRVKNSDS